MTGAKWSGYDPPYDPMELNGPNDEKLFNYRG